MATQIIAFCYYGSICNASQYLQTKFLHMAKQFLENKRGGRVHCAYQKRIPPTTHPRRPPLPQLGGAFHPPPRTLHQTSRNFHSPRRILHQHSRIFHRRKGEFHQSSGTFRPTRGTLHQPGGRCRPNGGTLHPVPKTQPKPDTPGDHGGTLIGNPVPVGQTAST